MKKSGTEGSRGTQGQLQNDAASSSLPLFLSLAINQSINVVGNRRTPKGSVEGELTSCWLLVEGSGGDWAMAGQEKYRLGQTVDLSVKRELATPRSKGGEIVLIGGRGSWALCY